MAKLFPTRFSLDWLRGPRTAAFSEREDAFQQLVGDALREERQGIGVFIAPTQGRDGSIDAFVEPQFEGDSCLQLSLPLIVECKDHDDQRAQLTRNYQQGWRKTRDKLQKYAEEGWPGAFQPWKRARSYLYCVSSSLPSKAACTELEDEIRAFFAGLTRAGKLQPINVRVMDWSDLRAWFDSHTRLRDRWCGTGLPGLIPHEEFLAQLSGFQRYLLESNLPFVPPSSSESTHPQQLWERLQQRANSGGLLLFGPGGVGKTRTSLEVARRADQEGWRVLHAFPGEHTLTVNSLAEEILEASQSTLLIFDYLDHMQVDHDSFRRTLLPLVRAKGMRLALLANTRPGYMIRSVQGREELWESISLRPEMDHRHAITQQVIAKLAPTAVKQLGAQQVQEFCGERPIIALFIAVQLEDHARAGGLSAVSLADLRAGDLVPWLRRRLREDQLAVAQPASHLLPSDPEPQVIAAAAALAATPQRMEPLIQAAAVSLQQDHRAGSPETALRQATHLVGVLERLGWLERHGLECAPAHDVVVDVLLEEVLRDKPSFSVRQDVLERILTAGLQSSRTMGRFATTLARLVGQEPDRAGGFDERLQTAMDEWFERFATELGQSMRSVPADEGSYALGALVGSAPCSDALARHWASVVQPWLQRFGHLFEARHLFYRSLKQLPLDSPRAELLALATEWCRRHGHHHEASFVLAATLAQNLADSGARPVIQKAITWLTLHGSTVEAQYVLKALLLHPGLGPETPRVIEHALVWLQGQSAFAHLEHVLEPLLTRHPQGTHTPHVVRCSLTWIEERGTEYMARWVLAALLSHTGLDPQQESALHAATFRWLKFHGKSPPAGMQLKHLLERYKPGKTPGESPVGEELLDMTLAWLQEHVERPDADFVLARLIAHPLGANTHVATAHAMRWLKFHGTSPRASFLLAALLERKNLGADIGDVIATACQWLELNGTLAEAEFVLTRLIRLETAEPQASIILKHAQRWLAQNEEAHPTNYFLTSVLECRDLGDQHAAIIGSALRWLKAYGTTPEARYPLKSLLQRKDLGEAIHTILEVALTWLRQYGKEYGSFILEPLVRSGMRVGSDPSLDYALDWVNQHLTQVENTYVLQAILERPRLDPHWQRCLATIFRWLEVYGRQLDASYCLAKLLARPELGAHANTAIAHALDWLKEHGESLRAHYVLTPLISRGDLGEQAGRCLDAVIRWQELHKDASEALPLFVATLERQDLGTRNEVLVQLSLDWLSHPTPGLLEQDGRHLLKVLLKRGDLGDSTERVLQHAFRWMDLHEQEPALPVLRTFLKHAAPAGFARLAQVALKRLQEMQGRVESRALLKAFLVRPDLAPYHQQVLDTAFAWLKEHGELLEASHVLNSLLMRADLGARAAEAATHALRWLELHAQAIEAFHLLLPLLRSKGLASEASIQARALSEALRWLSRYREVPEGRSVLMALFERKDLGAHTDALHEHALFWLRRYGQEPDSPVFRAMLQIAPQTSLSRLVQFALGRYKEIEALADSRLLLEPLLARPDLREHRDLVLDAALGWMKRHGHLLDGSFTLAPMLTRKDLASRAAEAGACALRWLALHGHTSEASYVLVPLLEHKQLMGEPSTRAAASSEALRWLAIHGGSRDASRALLALLKVVPPEQLARVAELCLRWMELHPTQSQREFMLMGLLRQPRIANETWLHVAQLALPLVQGSAALQRRTLLLDSLLRRSMLWGDRLPEIIREAQHHLQTAPPDPNSTSLAELLRRLDQRQRTGENRLRGAPPPRPPGSSQRDPAPTSIPFHKLVENLEKLASSSTVPPLDFIQESLTRVAKQANIAAASAGFAIPALLSLTARLGMEDLQHQSMRVAEQVIQKLDEGQRKGLASACHRKLSSGAWSDTARGANVLSGLGLPPPRADPPRAQPPLLRGRRTPTRHGRH